MTPPLQTYFFVAEKAVILHKAHEHHARQNEVGGFVGEQVFVRVVSHAVVKPRQAAHREFGDAFGAAKILRQRFRRAVVIVRVFRGFDIFAVDNRGRKFERFNSPAFLEIVKASFEIDDLRAQTGQRLPTRALQQFGRLAHRFQKIRARKSQPLALRRSQDCLVGLQADDGDLRFVAVAKGAQSRALALLGRRQRRELFAKRRLVGAFPFHHDVGRGIENELRTHRHRTRDDLPRIDHHKPFRADANVFGFFVENFLALFGGGENARFVFGFDDNPIREQRAPLFADNAGVGAQNQIGRVARAFLRRIDDDVFFRVAERERKQITNPRIHIALRAARGRADLLDASCERGLSFHSTPDCRKSAKKASDSGFASASRLSGGSPRKSRRTANSAILPLTVRGKSAASQIRAGK